MIDAEGRLGEVVLQARAVSKSFFGSKALDRVDLDLRAGEVRALAGQNGSGKSTLIKLIAGLFDADPGGEVSCDGTSLSGGSREVADVRRHIRIMHQDLGLVMELSAAENLAARGAMPWSGLQCVTEGQMSRTAEELLEPFGLDIDVGRPVGSLTPIERSVIALAGTVSRFPTDAEPRLIMLDEPTAALPPSEVGQLVSIVRRLSEQGSAILFVSHRIEEMFALADSVTVLRDGRLVGTYGIHDITRSSLVEMMIGEADLERHELRAKEVPDDAVAADVRGLVGRHLRGIDFTVHEGEILGIAGLPDSGSQELPYCLVGAGGPEADGLVRFPARSPQWRRIAAHPELPIVPADRIHEALFEGLTVNENLTAGSLSSVSRAGFLGRSTERAMSDSWLRRLDVRSVTADAPIDALSGGNQQKVVFGRCLAQAAPIVALCEPTAGVDIGAREKLYDVLLDAARAGTGAVVSSSDLTDLLALCTRVLVICDGQIGRELRGDQITENAMLHAMEGW
jgi:ABC-type sugar transport system ATPase subunit